jgi:hypothetical protein
LLEVSNPSQPRWSRNAALARYLNVSAMCLWRWQRDPRLSFPQPTVINKYSYTDLNQVDQWMRERVVDRTRGRDPRATAHG